MKLTTKQALFVKEYLIDFNATQAAIRAGYSPRTARAIASENLKKPAIAKEISRAKARLRKRLDATTEKITRELAQIAFANIGDVLGKDGLPLPIEEWPPEVWPAIRDVRVRMPRGADLKGRRPAGMRLKLQNKVKALELLGKRMGLF